MPLSSKDQGSIENSPIKKIEIVIENSSPQNEEKKRNILNSLHTKQNHSYSHATFDKDLKKLSTDYDQVKPIIIQTDNGLIITLTLKEKPHITHIDITGSSIKSSKIIKKSELILNQVYSHEELYTALNRIREFYIKKGYFQVKVNYIIENSTTSNSANLIIKITEGKKGIIHNILFKGFNSQEKKSVLNLINSSKHNLFSWLTGAGILNKEMVDQDTKTIIDYMQNQGYADAHVAINIVDLNKKDLALEITLNRGEKYHFNTINFKGLTSATDHELENEISLKQGTIYSTRTLQNAQNKIKSFYTNQGRIDTTVNYTLATSLEDPYYYDVTFQVEESKVYNVGCIHIKGNRSTNKNTVYNRIDLTPGDSFEKNALIKTQNKLLGSGLYKNVNVYTTEHPNDNHDYKDVVIDIKEASTGSMNFFAGANSTQNIFGGLNLTENNFNISGLGSIFSEGINSLRGGGEYFDVKVQLGDTKNYSLSWLNPYFMDSLWRFGAEFSYNKNSVLSDDYDLHTIGNAISATYPISPYFYTGMKTRIKNSKMSLYNPLQDEISENDATNSGLVAGVAWIAGYDSTDNTFKPHRGIRSNIEVEIASLLRSNRVEDFPFIKYGYLNSIYVPVTQKSTLKLRGDAKFITPLQNGTALGLPLTERFFLGGEDTVRGYKPAAIGPEFGDRKPTGGISSLLLTAEYKYNIIKPLDVFTFFDSGSINNNTFKVDKLKMSYGIGARIDIGSALPFVLGYGIPINESDESKVQKFFFSMSGTF